MIEVTLRGNFYQIGVEHGRLFANDIRPRVNQFWNQSVNENVLKALEKTVSFLENLFPNLIQEIRGISEGSGCSFESVFLYNNRTLLDATAPVQCTHIAVSRDEAVAVGMNKDMLPPLTDMYFIKRVFPENATAFIGYGHVGRVWGYGMNEAGLCMAGTAAYPMENRSSVPSVGLYLLSPILLSRCRTATEAVETVMSIDAVSEAGNLLLADAAGQMRVMEITPHKRVIRTPDGGIIFSSNLFASGQIEHRDDPEFLQEARDRYRVIDELCQSKKKGAFELIQKVLSVHRDRGSVCRHQDPGFQTALSWMADPMQGHFFICEGPPCQTVYKKLTLRDETVLGR